MLHSNRSRSPYEDGTKPMTVHSAVSAVTGPWMLLGTFPPLVMVSHSKP